MRRRYLSVLPRPRQLERPSRTQNVGTATSSGFACIFGRLTKSADFLSTTPICGICTSTIFPHLFAPMRRMKGNLRILARELTQLRKHLQTQQQLHPRLRQRIRQWGVLFPSKPWEMHLPLPECFLRRRKTSDALPSKERVPRLKERRV